MNAAKVTLTSTILAAALGLALGLAAAPAMADPPDPETGHNHGGGAISDNDPPWAVELFELVGIGPATKSPCPGTPVQNKDTLAADFDTGCTIFMTSGDTPIGEFGLSLFRVELRNKGNGLPEAMLAFTTNPDFSIGDIAEVWSTDRMTVDITEDDPFPGWITLTPSPSGLPAGPLTKEHQPGKGDVTDQNVSFSEIVYEPIN